MKQRPRIAVVTPNFPNSADPYLAIYIYHAVRALQRWAEVATYCVVPSYSRFFLRPRERAYRRIESNFILPNMQVLYINYPAIPLLTRFLNGRTAARYLWPHLHADPPDLILAYWIYPEGEGAIRVGAALDVPVIVQALGSDLKLIPDPFTAHGVRNTLQQASFVLTVSDDLRRRAIMLGAAPDKVRTVLNGCDPTVFRVGDRAEARARLDVPSSRRLVIYVGRLDPIKGVGDLLEATARLLPSQPELQVVCIGTGVSESRLRARAARPDLAAHVRFVGQCEPGEVARWLAAADLLCLPSHSEGCPNVVVEALACGRPVVATTVGGIPELVDDSCAVLTAPGTPAALAEALATALGRRWDERGIAARSRRSWEDVGRETHEVCQAVIRTREMRRGAT